MTSVGTLKSSGPSNTKSPKISLHRATLWGVLSLALWIQDTDGDLVAHWNLFSRSEKSGERRIRNSILYPNLNN